MARAYIVINCNDEPIRTFGGNMSDVKCLKKWYENCTLDEFKQKHNYLTEEHYRTLAIRYTRK